MRVAIVSTYPPRPCGIGTFSRDLRAALLEADDSTDVDIVSIVRESHDRGQSEVVAAIHQDVRSDYAAVARTLTSRGTDVVLVEHEYGIFGGQAGSFVLSLVDELRQPLVVTLHTVLAEPSVPQAETLRELCHRATLVTVFTETARRMVVDAALVPPERVRIVPHGAPTMLLPDSSTAVGSEPAVPAITAHRPALERLEGRTVLSTFGLISAGKGIEVAISALPTIVAKHPEVVYLIAGQTHPEVVKQEGERYRLSLERLVRDLDLGEHVHFLDRFLSVEELAVLLSTTDLYITPYRSREQIVSGALTFAVVAGCPVVSTPYYYAEDLLSSGAGVLVPPNDPEALAEQVVALLDDPMALDQARAEARRVGAELTWPSVGAQTLRVLAEAVDLGPITDGDVVAPAVSGPHIRPDHLLTMVDDVGVVQHADGVVPNRASGYCVDDAARLVIVAIGLDRDRIDATYDRMLTLGLSFLRHAWDPASEAMHNLMAYDRHWIDEPYVGDHVGRAVWALGEVVAASPPRAVATPSLRLLTELAPTVRESTSPRHVAFTVLGLCRPETGALPAELEELLVESAGRLTQWYTHTRSEEWRWFEDYLTYDNARLAQALLAAGHRLGDEQMLGAGLEALQWYGALCRIDEPVVRLVGNGWHQRGDVAVAIAAGDEQPLDAAALVEAYAEAANATGERAYGRQAVHAFEWFFGRNRLGVPVYDFATGGCHDGLGAETLNDNEGAESTLAFLQALLALDAAGLQASLPRS
ncbi:MAG TPA: glycosyltransferase [Nocardioidaceae bacterium]|jgi:glycosyltransferase involved in cell wall biosynthesis|nr:glycosyltransferase [Nocardioidaceae bacterium]